MKHQAILFLIISLLTSAQAMGQAYDLRLETVTNDAVTGGNFDVKVQIKSSTGSFGLGLGNLSFSYNTLGLYASVAPDDGNDAPEIYAAHNFNSVHYHALTLTEPVRGVLSLNVNYDFEFAGNGQTVGTSWIDVATIRFTIRNTMENTGLEWQDDATSGALNPVIVYTDGLPAALVSRHSVSGNATALPVHMLYFTASRKGRDNAMQWATASEENCDRFDIERSINALEWETIGRVPGNGNSFQTLYYAFIDGNSPTGSAYYRLKQVDYDGSENYSRVALVGGLDLHGQLALFPNPARTQVQVELEGEGQWYGYYISHANGGLVKEGRLPSGQSVLDISGLSPGFYILVIPGIGSQRLMVD